MERVNDKLRYLDRKILDAFKQATREGKLEVAEHLMRALESLSRELDNTYIDQAYQVVADEFRPDQLNAEAPAQNRRAEESEEGGPKLLD